MRQLTALLGVLLVSTAAAQQQPGYHYGPGMMGDGWWFSMLMWPLMMIVFIAVLVVLAVAAIRWIVGSERHRLKEPPESGAKIPLDILKERFARGEIDKEEFEERRRLLKEE